MAFVARRASLRSPGRNSDPNKQYPNLAPCLNQQFPGDIEVCCNDWQRPAPAYTGWRTDDVEKDGGTFGFGELLFTSDTEMTFRAWSAVNRSVLFEASVSFA